MRKLLILAPVIILFITACKKTEVVPGLIGKWELRHESGGWGHDSTLVAGNGNIYEFNRDSTYKRYHDGALAASCKFHIRKGNGYQMQSVNSILFDNDPYGEPVVISGVKLSIGTSVADGITYEYIKIN